jgi:hypothetical protein
MPVIQTKDKNLAQTEAKAMSKKEGYAAIVLSKGVYYIESTCQIIRTWETLVDEFENGIKKPKTD